MQDDLVSKIRTHVLANHSLKFRTSTLIDVDLTESALGFKIPKMLRMIYLEVGNGGIGPGQGGSIIGIKDGYKSAGKNLAELYQDIRENAFKHLGFEWQVGLLPFCDWGSNIYSCVDCIRSDNPIKSFAYNVVRLEPYDLSNFFQMWLQGVDILKINPIATETVEMINPFTGRKEKIKKICQSGR
jgi:hypothetical protein